MKELADKAYELSLKNNMGEHLKILEEEERKMIMLSESHDESKKVISGRLGSTDLF
jgi:hypothetical protein